MKRIDKKASNFIWNLHHSFCSQCHMYAWEILITAFKTWTTIILNLIIVDSESYGRFINSSLKRIELCSIFNRHLSIGENFPFYCCASNNWRKADREKLLSFDTSFKNALVCIASFWNWFSRMNRFSSSGFRWVLRG